MDDDTLATIIPFRPRRSTMAAPLLGPRFHP